MVAIYDRAIVRLLPAVPKPVVRRISDRYIAGTELDDAEAAVSPLNHAGMLATVDVLGHYRLLKKHLNWLHRNYRLQQSL